jgi:uncharacterized membrane protein YgaE (UPF0421/DUF939 family)
MTIELSPTCYSNLQFSLGIIMGLVIGFIVGYFFGLEKAEDRRENE